jgi:hypothetical protein
VAYYLGGKYMMDANKKMKPTTTIRGEQLQRVLLVVCRRPHGFSDACSAVFGREGSFLLASS